MTARLSHFECVRADFLKFETRFFSQRIVSIVAFYQLIGPLSRRYSFNGQTSSDQTKLLTSKSQSPGFSRCTTKNRSTAEIKWGLRVVRSSRNCARSNRAGPW
jgi:hypothetical protein